MCFAICDCSNPYSFITLHLKNISILLYFLILGPARTPPTVQEPAGHLLCTVKVPVPVPPEDIVPPESTAQTPDRPPRVMYLKVYTQQQRQRREEILGATEGVKVYGVEAAVPRRRERQGLVTIGLLQVRS